MSIPEHIHLYLLLEGQGAGDLSGVFNQGALLEAVRPYVVVGTTMGQTVLVEGWCVLLEVGKLRFLYLGTHFRFWTLSIITIIESTSIAISIPILHAIITIIIGMRNPNDNPPPVSHALQLAFTHSTAQHNNFFTLITHKCTTLQESLICLQEGIIKLEDKLRMYNGGGDRIMELRDKQKQFIIRELEGKVKRVEASQEAGQVLLAQKEAALYELQYKYQDLRLENTEIK